MSKKDDTIKVSSESKLQLPLANLIGIIIVVSGAVFGYANLTGRISALETADCKTFSINLDAFLLSKLRKSKALSTFSPFTALATNLHFFAEIL